MDNEQTQQRLLKRRENYKRWKEKGNEVEISCIKISLSQTCPIKFSQL